MSRTDCFHGETDDRLGHVDSATEQRWVDLPMGVILIKLDLVTEPDRLQNPKDELPFRSAHPLPGWARNVDREQCAFGIEGNGKGEGEVGGAEQNVRARVISRLVHPQYALE